MIDDLFFPWGDFSKAAKAVENIKTGREKYVDNMEREGLHTVDVRLASQLCLYC